METPNKETKYIIGIDAADPISQKKDYQSKSLAAIPTSTIYFVNFREKEVIREAIINGVKSQTAIS